MRDGTRSAGVVIDSARLDGVPASAAHRHSGPRCASGRTSAAGSVGRDAVVLAIVGEVTVELAAVLSDLADRVAELEAKVAPPT